MSADGSAGNVVVILSTAPQEEEALKIARTLVEEHLVACVNVVPGIRSIYFWEEKVQDDPELQLVIKTTRANSEKVIARIQELHSYTCPEAIVLPLVGGSSAYLKWVEEVTR